MSSASSELAEDHVSAVPIEPQLALRMTWRMRLPAAEACGLLVFLFLAVVAESRASGSELVALGVYVALLVLGWIGVRYYTFTDAENAIVFEQDALCMPRHVGARHTVRVPYADVWTVEEPGRYARGQVLIGTRREVYRYPELAFAVEAPARVLSEWVAARLAELPDGAALRASFEQRSRLAQQLRARPAHATWTIVAVLCAVFALQSAIFGDDEWRLVRIGAEVPLLVLRGEIYRVCTGGLLHVGLMHLLSNTLALVWVGRRFERVFGPAALVTVFFAAIIGGSFAGFRLSQGHFVSVGASGGVFGVMAGCAVLNYARGQELPAALKIASGTWMALAFNNLIAPLTHSEIDWRAHLGGAVTGALLAFALLNRASLADIQARRPRWLRPTAQAMLGVFSLSSIVAAVHAAARDDADERLLSARFLGDSEPKFVNAGAWTFAISRKSTLAELARAREATQRAIAAGDTPELRDTLATLEYRLGDYAQAISDELVALKGADTPFHRAQLARFLRAQVEHAGTLVPADFPIRLGLSSVGAGAALRLQTDPPLEPDERLEVYGYAVQGSHTLGLLSMVVSGDGTPGVAIDASERWPAGTRFKIGMVRRLAAAPCAATSCNQAKFSAMTGKVEALP